MDWVGDSNAALLTDLYELTMAASYHSRGMNDTATFDLFIRQLPESRNFLVVGGVDEALDYLEGLAFDTDSLDYLESLGIFKKEFLDHLQGLRFTGDVMAMPEGEIAFANEPIVSVTAPLIEAQLVESFLLNCITFQTMVASKAARVRIACGEKSFVDFSLRRDHGADAALKAARASWLGGADGTSNVLAGKLFGIPVSGTMAHSYVMSFPTEIDAFRAFSEDFPDRSILLIDTFQTEEGARATAQVAAELLRRGIEVKGVRIDSGDLAVTTRNVRKILDEAGLGKIQIFLSGDLDEYRIAELVAEGVPADAFGVGTQLGTSGDAPSLGGVYKLVQLGDRLVHKTSIGKVTVAGRKQVYRFPARGFERDIVAALSEEVDHEGRPLLEWVMESGRRTARWTLGEARARCLGNLEALPPTLRNLYPPPAGYEPDISDDLLSRSS